MFLKKYSKDLKFIILTVLFTFIFLESIALTSVYLLKNSEISNYLSIITPGTKAHIDIADNHLADMARVFYDTDINTPEVQNILYQATQTKDEHTLASLRKKLLNRLSSTYSYMQKYNIRQLHFHLPNAISFLRFHKPNKFGDSLIGIRDTLEYVNKNRTFIHTFEEGRILNGFRNVYPFYKGKTFIGTVEISFSFAAMQELLSRIDGSSYLFIIDANVVSTKVFESEKAHYQQSEFSDYLYDKATLNNTMQLDLNTMRAINNKIADYIDKKLQKDETFSLNFRDKNLFKNNSIVITFIPIRNLEDRVVAYTIHYEFGDFIDIICSNMKVLAMALSVLALLLSAALLVLLLTERKKHKTIHSMAVHDALTKIYNRHGANELLNHRLHEIQRGERSLSVIFFDIDYFKKVNDTYGHDIGDYVLVRIAELVSDEMRSSDIFARWGGEEFILFLIDTKIEDAINVAEKLRKTIETHAFADIERVTCSFGVTSFQEGDDKNSLLKRVDAYLYQAKESGRNCVIDDTTI